MSNTGTDLEAHVSVSDEATVLPSVDEMAIGELLREVVSNQRVMMAQFSAIVSSFSEIQETIQNGGIAGLFKGLMGR